VGLARLRQLLGIAEQHQVPGRSGHRQHVGQRQLPRLVDEEGVHAALELRSRPQPDGAARDIKFPVLQGLLELAIAHADGA
jgi:hypothetical protein